MSLLIIGATGTLGRQIVLQALNKGYKVRCLIRNFQKANFLKRWGSELVYGDLNKPETIPQCLKGITAIIDASAGRLNELNSLKKVDWESKIFLIQAAKFAKIKRFIFFSLKHKEKIKNITFLRMKDKLKSKLIESKIPYTIFKLTGFYQGLIEQYAIPILENIPIWLSDEKLAIAYMDTQDIAKFCLRALQLPRTEYQSFLLDGTKTWTSKEIIILCEQFVGQSATIKKIPAFILDWISTFFGFFDWGEMISNRLAFIKILNIQDNLLKNSEHIFFKKLSYHVFKIDEDYDLVQLEEYFSEYFIYLLKRLRDIKFEDIQKQKNIIL